MDAALVGDPPRAAAARAFDPRLVQHATATRRFLGVAVALGAATAALVMVQAAAVSTVVANTLVSHRSLAGSAAPLAVLFAAVTGRSLVIWGTEVAAERTSASAKSDLRNALVRKVSELGGRAGVDGARTTVLAVTGVDALDAYFSRYVPQVLVAVIVPLAVIAVVSWNDWVSGALLAVTVPLIPIFMALVGATTRSLTERRQRALERLAGHFLDVVSGLPTLKVFGRTRSQAAAIAEVTDRFRRASMSTLRLSFLSALILELLATVSVALVAVAVGLRLLGGHLDFRTSLFVLVLAPEAFLPLRQLASQYHASADGIRAAQEIFSVLDREPARRKGERRVPEAGLVTISVASLGVTYPDRAEPAVCDVTCRIDPGEVVALVGASGCGKSTVLDVLCGLVQPTSGSVAVGGIDLADLDLDAWRSQLAWVPQRPHLFAASVADNLRLGRPDATDDQLRRAARLAHLDEVLARLPEGLGSALGERGSGLSRGERQRVALARAFLRDAPVLLLDEPTAGLDGATEELVVDAIGRLVADRTVVMATHRPALLALADTVVQIDTPEPAATAGWPATAGSDGHPDGHPRTDRHPEERP